MVIIEAYYGDSSQIALIGGPIHLRSKIVDVTEPLRFFVDKDSQLKIKAHNRDRVYGFYQVDSSAVNHTLIVYHPNGKPGVVMRTIFKDNEPIIL